MAEPFIPNLIIAASAGTGKTQTLANRIITLMRDRHVPPQEIVALTFSRAAAGEIFGRFVTLLAESIGSDPRHADLLRKAIATQHLSQIGTLDSFMMRIVRNFPLEMGLSGERRILDDHQVDLERQRISFSVLRRTDKATAKAFHEAFAQAMNHWNVRSFVEAYRTFISQWHDRYLEHATETAWGDPCAIWGEVPAFVQADESTLATAADSLVGLLDHPDWPNVVDWVRHFRGSFSDAKKGLVSKLLEREDLFSEGALEIKFNKRTIAFDSAKSKTVRNALACVFGYVLRQKLETAAGVCKLIAAFEREYAVRVRARGKLLFSDVPRLICQLEPSARQALEFRMDARIGAWALDEFQDTSRKQWQALEGLIEEAKQSDGEKSVLIVGDRKQAIYGWRAGDVGILTREQQSGAYVEQALTRTYRSGPAVIEAVNRIFVDGRLPHDFPHWESPRHETAKPTLDGFVQRIVATSGSKEAFVEPIANALKAVDPVGRGISTAILVRSNKFGEYLANALKREGVSNVVWEGESDILDTPALLAFLDLTVLADHPGNQQAYRHFCASPLARARYGAEVPSATELSVACAEAFATRGLVRVFREWRALLPADPEVAWSRSVEMRFTEMLRVADQFELEREPSTRLSDFTAYVEAHTRRQVAEAGRIKVISIHRSKGLGFDYVLVPLYERNGIPNKYSGVLEGEGWVLPEIPDVIQRNMPVLRSAWQVATDREEQEALCTYYVALTRAKRAMTLVTMPPPKKNNSDAVRFSDYVRDLPEAIGRPDWYTEFPLLSAQPNATLADVVSYVRRPREHLRRRLPSLGFSSGQRAGDLFEVSARKAALERGTSVHAAYEQVEFDDWLVRPADFSGLWRERAFEIFDGTSWISGRFDRVVFTGTGDERRATIYDFKTNRNSRHLSDADFDAALRQQYAAQLDSYRRALSVLVGLPLERISTVLLLTETHRTVPMV